MRRKQAIAAVSLLAVAGVIVYLSRRRRTKHINRLKTELVAEHGYETAHDVLFPKKRKKNLKTR
jgi:hypothetical protein